MGQSWELEGDTIRITLTSIIQQDILDLFKADLMDYIRNKLENDKISIQAVINEEESEKKLYTSKEKLDFLISRNPAIAELQKKLGLDPDY